MEMGEGGSNFYWDFSMFTKGNPMGIVKIIGNYFRLFPPTYSVDKLGSSKSTSIDESELLHKDYFPVITSIKHLPRRGP